MKRHPHKGRMADVPATPTRRSWVPALRTCGRATRRILRPTRPLERGAAGLDPRRQSLRRREAETRRT
jgi:hypothetical protein